MSAVRRIGVAFACAALVSLLPLAPPALARGEDYWVASLEWSAVPIAERGTLAPGASKTLYVTARDEFGTPMADVWIDVYGYLDAGWIDYQDCGDGYCYTDGNGRISIVYHAPSILPAGGAEDVISATAHGAGAETTYRYDHVNRLQWNHRPIELEGALAPGASVPLTVTATDSSRRPMRSTPIQMSTYTSFGTFDLPGCDAQGTCITDANGQVSGTYRAAIAIPASGGQDTISASAGGEQESTWYSYPSLSSLSWDKTPIAEAGTLWSQRLDRPARDRVRVERPAARELLG